MLTLLQQKDENLLYDITSNSELDALHLLRLQGLPTFTAAVDEEGPKIRRGSNQKSEASINVSNMLIYPHTRRNSATPYPLLT